MFFSLTLNASLSSFPLFDIKVQVIDGETNEPIIGATLNSDDFKFQAITDIEGKASITGLSHRDKVTFSYVGYMPIKLAIYEIREMKGLIKMYAANTLDSVVVIGRKDEPINEIPYYTDQITSSEIQFRNAQTTADALGALGDVFVQKSQLGGGSPIIRGFEANRVLLVVDGVRMNNAIYREGHLQNSITVDNAILDQMGVIYGPGSLMYGSDALGGVVHFRTKDPKVLFGNSKSNTAFHTGAYTRFASANSEKSIHVDLDYRTRHWGSFTSLTYVNYGDLETGSNRSAEFPDFGKRNFYQSRLEQDMRIGPVQNPDILRSTGYSQIDFLQKIKYQPNEKLYYILNFQYSTSSNVPRYDALTDTLAKESELKWAEWYYGPQKRLLSSLKIKSLNSNLLYDKATLIGSFQKIDEDRLQRRFSSSHRTFNLEDIYVFSLTADFDKYLDQYERNRFSYGVDLNYNKVHSRVGEINMATGAVRRGTEYTRYPSDFSTMMTYAGYANYRWKSRDSVMALNTGVRYSRVNLFVKYDSSDFVLIDWPSHYVTEGVSVTNSDLTWGTGLTINTKDKWQLRLNASTAFRSPNIDDFAKIRVKGGNAVVPNPNLKPETSLNGEVTLAKEFGSIRGGQGSSFKISGTGYYTYIDDVIVRLPGTINGVDTIVCEGGDICDVQQNFNATHGIIYGVSANVSFKLNDTWKLFSSINYTRGRTQYNYIDPTGEFSAMDTLVPLAHIPPLYGRASLIYQKNKLKLEGVIRFAGKKPLDEYSVNTAKYDGTKLILDREGTADNIEYTPIRVNENGEREYVGSLSWMTFNFYSTFKFNEKISIDLAVENITDLHYLPFGSGISAPGRNFIVTLRSQF